MSAAAAWPTGARMPTGGSVVDAGLPAGEAAASESPSQRMRRELLADPLVRVALAVLATITVACAVGPVLLPWGWDEVDPGALVGEPAAGHLLGTDAVGRDLLARLLAAGRISLLVGVSVALATTIIGAVIGMVAGLLGGRVDRCVMWMLDVLSSIPAIPMFVALAVLVANPGSLVGAAFAAIPEWTRIVAVMSLLGWMGTARLVRVRSRGIRVREHVEAARAAGARTHWIVTRHVLPGCLPLVLLAFTSGIGGAILGESFLSWLGVGVQPPVPTWGNMVEAASDLPTLRAHPERAFAPIALITLVVVAANVVGDAMRQTADMLDQ